ncbi:hypothetical protein [Nitrobacter winogradskyi]|uniref:Uncharacterized protein n=2 Tax=Nitrobacter winogradskyi TaxID=913 RepID=A0ACC6AFG3_NITWI|nr:hypothetical protein [Nitrobacter winogradskyi]MCP1998436.1 hypothetical protein [Nitrobacter winogradskyi]GEC16195.1 hypothetical protein NWI01_20870 [Nitrobacter winogradskyi]
MRTAVFALLLTISSTWSNLVQAESSSLRYLTGEWYQIDSNAGKCADCRILIERNGEDFTVKANNGWSAIVRPSFEGKPFVAGKGSWPPNFGDVYGGKAFFLNLGIKEDELLMLMTVPGRDGELRNVKAIFRRQTGFGKE